LELLGGGKSQPQEKRPFCHTRTSGKGKDGKTQQGIKGSKKATKKEKTGGIELNQNGGRQDIKKWVMWG